MRFLVVLVALVACGSDGDELTITIDTGTLHGGKTGDVRHFLGVPFAAPPVGELRFRAPQPMPPWSGVREAVDTDNECPQTLSLSGPSNTEDCLFLNVWTPSGAHDLPVMLFIHGGAFIFGSGAEKYYAGDDLTANGVIIVTINYRLGAFGFLAHPASVGEDPAYPTAGNYGIEDQRAALQWVQRNIAAFGGDPAHVTLFGESAGGASTCIHYVSSRSHGLFETAISESGLCTSSILEIPLATAEARATMLGEKMGCPGSDAAALACLRSKTTDEINTATAEPPLPTQQPGGLIFQADALLWALPVDDGFVIEQPLRALFAAGQFEPRPFILGSNKDEGTFFLSGLYAKAITNETDYRAALAVRFGASNVDAIVAMYPLAAFATPNAALAEVAGDAFFVCPTRYTARKVAAVSPTYRYTFQRLLENSFDPTLGAFHASELPFVFGTTTFPLGAVGAGEPLSCWMQDYWTSLAKHGDPNVGAVVPWPKYDAAEMTQVLDLPLTTTTAYKQAQCDFWDALPPAN